MGCRCGLDANERTSVLFDEKVLDVTEGSLNRDELESAKKAVEAATGASQLKKAFAVEWMHTKGWLSNE